jgi:Bacterial membrane protein YfhO
MEIEKALNVETKMIAQAGTLSLNKNNRLRAGIICRTYLLGWFASIAIARWNTPIAVVRDGNKALTCDSCPPVSVSEQFSDGWEVKVDGRSVDVVEVDGFLLGAFVEPGKHTVSFRYTPPGFHLGALIGLIAVVALAAVAFRESRAARSCKLERRKKSADA